MATADTEREWLEAARGQTTRQLEALVASLSPGDAPPAPDTPKAPQRHVLRFEVDAETLATFRDAMSKLRREAGSAMDDDALLLVMAQRVLGGASDDGRSNYRISLHVCAACGRGAQVAAGEALAVAAEVVAMAACDGQVVPGLAANENASPANDESVASSPSQPIARATPHVGQRAHQSVRPALRRAVLTRDRHGCQVPGCKNHIHVDVHHVRPRAEGGRNTTDNLITLCTAHHRAVHRGKLLIQTLASGEWSFGHADGTAYGGEVAATTADVHAKVFSALRQLGFREREVRAVLMELRADTGLWEANIGQLLREALSRIRAPSPARTPAPRHDQ